MQSKWQFVMFLLSFVMQVNRVREFPTGMHAIFSIVPHSCG